MKRIIEYIIPEIKTSYTIQTYLTELGYSSSLIKLFKKTPESVILNNYHVRLNTKICPLDKLVITVNEEDCSNITPIEMPLCIAYEDEDFIIINKSAGIPTIPSLNHHMDTLGNALCYYYKQQDLPFVFRPINRLDRNTSGLVLVAKNPIAAAFAGTMIKNNEINKTYLAIAEGTLPNFGSIIAPIGRCDGSLITRKVDPVFGEYACTHYKVLLQKNKYALASIKLETGRTHQIRVHFSHIGHPLAGDDLYGENQNIYLTRHALHANYISFIQPITKEKIECYVELPKDMQDFWKQMI